MRLRSILKFLHSPRVQCTSTSIVVHMSTGATYTLALHFAELIFEVAGARTLSVFANDVEIVRGLDVFAQAGGPLREGSLYP